MRSFPAMISSRFDPLWDLLGRLAISKEEDLGLGPLRIPRGIPLDLDLLTLLWSPMNLQNLPWKMIKVLMMLL